MTPRGVCARRSLRTDDGDDAQRDRQRVRGRGRGVPQIRLPGRREEQGFREARVPQDVLRDGHGSRPGDVPAPPSHGQ